ncbi:MAG: YdeI/OmpD-associated family protein [bacterium]|nr:YdeI/OmpD-associated family protein [bacterium]
MVKTENFQQVEITSHTQLRAWLSANHNQKESIWLVTYKKNVIDKYVSIQEVLDELLCFGWIDGLRRKLDENRTMQLIAPRKVEHWTKTYKDRYAKLESKGLIENAGREAVLKSKANGLWDHMDDVDALIKPTDFIKCLNGYENATNNFNKFGASSQRFILRWIKIAKTTETRAKRIKQASELAEKNQKIPGL